MRITALLVFFVLFCELCIPIGRTIEYGITPTTVCEGDSQETQTSGTKESSSKLQHLLDQARLAPAEFRSDALIRLAQSTLVSDRKLKRELLEEAFDFAANAQFQLKKTAFAPINVDTRLGYLDSAYTLNLDGVSLRCRAVDALLNVDKVRARELFSAIRLTDAIGSPLTCKDGLVYEVSAFYKTLKNVAENSFNRKEIKEGDRLNFVEQSINDITSPLELAPAAKLITSIDWASNDLQDLVHRYSIKLTQVSSDYRTFFASESLYSVTESIHHLMSYAERRQIGVQELVEAYRAYLIRNLSQKACADIDSKERHSPYFVRTANRLLFPHNPITPEEISAPGVEPSYKETEFWASPKSRLLLNEVRGLRFKKGEVELTASEKGTLEWDNNLNRVLNMLADWKIDDEQAKEDYFHEKAVIYRSLFELAATGKRRDDVLARFLLFLKEVDPDYISRIEMYWHMRAIVEAARGSDERLRTNTLNALLTSDNPVLRLYGLLSLEGL